ncbi:MAG: FG-GAP-like repeat-containing protein, partial [bacterium]
MKQRHLLHFCLFMMLMGERFLFSSQSGYYLDETESRLPENLQFSGQATMGDVDLDGDLDIVVANSYSLTLSSLNRLLINDGVGYFTDETESRFPFWEDNSGDVALLDIDGDGDLDYMAGNTLGNGAPDGKNRLYLNDGTGHFEDVSSERIPQNNEGTVVIAFADVDGDSDLDVFWASYLGTRLLMNDGQGYFADSSSTHLRPDTLGGGDAVFGDVDSDGDVDLLIAAFDSFDNRPNYLYINDGTGHFTEEGALRLPEIKDGSSSTIACTFGDIDGDGDLDILFANVLTLVLLLNDGSGYYAHVSNKRLPENENVHAWDAEFLDADLDGDLDIFVSASSGSAGGEQNLLYLNIGSASGSFTDATESWLPQQTESSNGIALGDVDGDKDIDIFLACDGYLQNHLFINYLKSVAVEETIPDIPVELSLLQNYPNPFNSRTRIGYEVANQESRITLSVYSLLGQEVVRLVDNTQEPGAYEVFWDGKNKSGEEVSSGVYIYALYAPGTGKKKQS